MRSRSVQSSISTLLDTVRAVCWRVHTTKVYWTLVLRRAGHLVASSLDKVEWIPASVNICQRSPQSGSLRFGVKVGDRGR
jgi:hypothetical protein